MRFSPIQLVDLAQELLRFAERADRFKGFRYQVKILLNSLKIRRFGDSNASRKMDCGKFVDNFPLSRAKRLKIRSLYIFLLSF